MKKRVILIVCLFLLMNLSVFSKENGFIYPISIKIKINSIFASFRGNHFHGGTDFSTYRKTGVPVRAVESGYIFRLSNKFYGYGKAVYIKHKNFMSVYAHLSKFEDKVLKLEKLSKKLSLKFDGRYFGDYFFENKGLYVKKGQIIAYSGESGAGPPHLHFEIRDLNNNPINTFNYIKIEDNIPPRIGKIILKPIKYGSFIDGGISKKIIKLNGKTKAETQVYVSGPFSIEITSWDKYYEYDRTVIYGWKVYIDNILLSKVKFDKIPFYRSRQIALIYDINRSIYKKDYFFYKVYPYYGTGLGKMFLSPEKLFEKLKNGKHTVKIEVFDYWGNKTIKTIDIIKIDNQYPEIESIKKISKKSFMVIFKKSVKNIKIEIKGEEEKNYYNVNYKKIDDKTISLYIPEPVKGLKYFLRVKYNKYSYSPWALKKFDIIDYKTDKFKIKKYSGRLKITSSEIGRWSSGEKRGKIAEGDNFIPIYGKIFKIKFGKRTYSFVFKKNGIKEKEEITLLSDDIIVKRKKTMKNSIYMGDYFYKRQAPDFKEYFSVKKGEIKKISIGNYEMLFGKDSLYKDFIFKANISKVNYSEDVRPLRTPLSISPDDFPFKQKILLKVKLTKYPFKKRVGVFRYNRMSGRWSLISDKIVNNHIVGKIWLGGIYSLMADEYPPELKFYFPKNGRTYGRVKKAVAIIRDKGKGIDYHKTFFIINGKKIWAVYDPDKASMFYSISKFVKKGKNILIASVEDYAGNISKGKIVFYKKGRR